MVLVDQSVELRKRFESAYINIKAVVPFDRTWRDDTGRLSGAVRADLKIGEVVKTICPDSGRRIIMVGTPMDTVVVYERYNFDEGKPFKLVYNANEMLDRLLGGSYLSIAQFNLVVTDYDVRENIGVFLDNMYVGMQKHAQVGLKKVI
jgi:hypothetical protein